MHEIISFSKEIEFKNMINKITSISLEHTLMLEDGTNIRGDFIVAGTYKMTAASQIENDFSYKIPVDIEVSEKYDLSNLVIDIDDFTYEVIDEEILKVNIDLLLDHLELRQQERKEENEKEEETQNMARELDDLFLEVEDEKELTVPRDEDSLLDSEERKLEEKEEEAPQEPKETEVTREPLREEKEEIEELPRNGQKEKDSIRKNLPYEEEIGKKRRMDRYRDSEELGVSLDDLENNSEILSGQVTPSKNTVDKEEILSETNSYTQLNIDEDNLAIDDTLPGQDYNLPTSTSYIYETKYKVAEENQNPSSSPSQNNTNSNHSSSKNTSYSKDNDDNQKHPNESNQENQESFSYHASSTDTPSLFASFDNTNETYSTYRIYILRENDSIEEILTKYKITRESLEEYNDLSELKIGTKLIIPSTKHE